MRVFVYKNLHKDCWSLRALDTHYAGLVVAHCDACYLYDGVFRVSQAGRERVLKHKIKNVHAGIAGYLVAATNLKMRYDLFPLPKKGEIKKYYIDEQMIPMLPLWEGERHAYYNPYKVSTFVDIEDGLPLDEVEAVYLTGKGRVEYIK